MTKSQSDTPIHESDGLAAAVERSERVPVVALDGKTLGAALWPAIEDALANLHVDYVALAGFMRILKAPLLEAFPRRIINLHPSLLPKFPGREAWAQALALRRQVRARAADHLLKRLWPRQGKS